jgi:hypothetical protein
MTFNGDISLAEQWCLLVLENSIFQNCSTTNRGVLQRLETDVVRFGILGQMAKTDQKINDLRIE